MKTIWIDSISMLKNYNTSSEIDAYKFLNGRYIGMEEEMDHHNSITAHFIFYAKYIESRILRLKFNISN